MRIGNIDDQMKGEHDEYGNPYQQGEMHDPFELLHMFEGMPSVCLSAPSNGNKAV